MEYALAFGRGLDAHRGDRFIGMYVNELTQDYGDEGRQAVRELLSRAEAPASTSPSRRVRPVSRAVVLVGVRTPIGRYGGVLSGVRPDDLAAIAIRAAVTRAGVPPEQIEDVYFGAANQAGEDNRNVARMARAARRAAGVRRRRDGEPAVRLRSRRGFVARATR